MIKKRRVAIDEFHNYKMFGVSRLKIIDELLELYDDSRNCQYQTYQEQIDDELKSKRLDIEAIITRYFALQESYLYQNQKHFDELCDNYFDNFRITENDKGD